MSLELVKRHGSPFWYIRGSVRGIAVDRSTKTDNEKAAEAIKIKTEAELLNRSIFGAKATVTFLECAVSHMKNGGEALHVAPLLKYFKGRKLSSIGQADIDQAAHALYPAQKPSTRDRCVYSPMSAILRHGAKRQWCEFIVLDRPRYNNARVRWLTVTEANSLVDHCSEHLRPLVIFLFGTGARLSEALYLQWADVDMKRKQVSFLDTKNGESRGVPMSDLVMSALATLPNQIGPVFLTNTGKPYSPRGDGGGQIKTAFNGAVRRAGLVDFTPHDCRHTWATWHYAANRDLAQLQKLGGWKSHEMVLRYAHVNVENMAHGIQAMGW
jgi:integrase